MEHDDDHEGAHLERTDASLASHIAILRGLLIALGICEIAARSAAVPSVLGDGLAGLLALPFFAPSMLGAFASQVLLRPVRAELVASLAIAALAFVPLLASVAHLPLGPAMAASAALGLGSLVTLGASWLRHDGRQRPEALGVFVPALLLPCFVALAHPMVFLTAALWPTTYDHRLYLADAAFGAPLSFVVGQATAAVPLLPGLCLAVYVSLPLALMLVHTLRRRGNLGGSDALVAFVAVTVVGYFGYLAVPVAGPVYAFPEAFPQAPPDPQTLGIARTMIAPMPRNCMPSLHSAWALLVYWNARPLQRGARITAFVFLAITLLATVGLGFHYVVDLVAAFPLALAAQAWATQVSDSRPRRRAMVFGFATTIAWMALVTWSGGLLHWPAALCWLVAAAIVATSWGLEVQVGSLRVSDDGATRPCAPASPESATFHRGSSLVLVVAGLAAWLHWSVFSTTLTLTLGATSGVRILLAGVVLLALAVGMAAGPWARTAVRTPLSLTVATAWSLALVSWSAQALLPAALEAYFALAGGTQATAVSILAGRLAAALVVLAPAAFVSGLLAGLLTQQLAESRRTPWCSGSEAASGVGLLLGGAAFASLAVGYAVLPSLYSSGAPVVLLALAALIVTAGFFGQRRAESVVDATAGETLEQARGQASANPTAIAPSPAPGMAAMAGAMGAMGTMGMMGMMAMTAVLGAVAGAVVVTCSRLLLDVSGDTVYSRAQLGFLACSGLAAGVLLLRRRLRPDQAATTLGAAILAMAACLLLGTPLWELVPGYYASFAAYVDEHQMATYFAQRELVRLAVGGLFLFLPALCVGAAWTAAAVLANDVDRRPTVFPRHGSVGVAGFAAGMMLASWIAPGPKGTEDWSGSGRTFAAADLRGHDVSRAATQRSAPTVAATAVRDDASRIGLGLAEADHDERVLVVGNATTRDSEDDVAAPLDGRAWLLLHDTRFDRIVVEHRSADDPDAAAYLTREWYELAAARLEPQGVLLQELGLDALSAMGLTSVLASARFAFEEVAVVHAGGRALVLACPATCRTGLVASNAEAEDGGGDGTGALRVAGHLHPEDVDQLLDSSAGQLGVAREALGSRDQDLFLPYHAPLRFLEDRHELPASVEMLRRFADTSSEAH